MLDGAGLRQSWYSALESAQNYFRQLLVSHSSPDWKRVNDASTSNSSNSSQPSNKGKARASSTPQPHHVIIHRKVTKTGSVYRAVLDVPVGEDGLPSLESCKAVLLSPELRKEWDPAVEGAQLLEMCDQVTRVVKTQFTLGWPASPRDAVTISRTFNDSNTLIDVSTSLPRSPNEPAYLRPSPPYVRSEVALFAWCIQVLKPQTPSGDPPKHGSSRLRITCFWQHDLRAMWNFGSTSSMAQQLSAMMIGFFKTVKSRGTRIPLLMGYGNGVAIDRVRFQVDREALTVEYSILPEEEDHGAQGKDGVEGLDAIKEHRRLTRSIECALPANEGWDVQLATRASSEEVQRLPWTAHATTDGSATNKADEKIIFNVKHASLPNDHSVLKVTIVIELSGPSSGLRLNGIPQPIERLEERDLHSYFTHSMLQDASSTAEYSLRSQTTFNTATTGASSTSTVPERPPLGRAQTERTAAAQKSILARVKRNYIYFSSLLQEPEAKWKRTTEARGVSIAQLDSIDPTLVVYRAEATFVGLGLWDLFAAVTSPGARAYWDKLYDDDVLLEDVNQLTELWHFKSRPAWPANGRDAVVLKTVYKSPTTIHVFAFSADDPNLFPNIPPPEPNTIRTQVDLQGWAIEALSPTTTLLTLLEQSDPKGWTNKTSIPQQMITAMTGVGDFAIKFGGPPIVTRLEGAKANEMRYDHDRGQLKLVYEGCADRRSTPDDANNTEKEAQSPSMPVIECELRCDLDTWATSLDIVVDPPPQAITCLRRHRLSSSGGGLWLTITHDAVHASDERLLIIVRKAPQGVAKEKGVVMVNGARVPVDVEDLPEKEAKLLAKQKRVKPVRVPLDQPPVLGVIRRRRAEWNDDDERNGEKNGDNSSEAPSTPASTEFSSTAPKFVTTWTKYFSSVVEQATATTQQAVAAISPAIASGIDAVPSSSKQPMQYALEALAFLQRLHSRPTLDGWTLVSEKDFPVHRKLCEDISPVIPVHKGEKVIEGVSAEEVVSALTSYDSRKQWDTRFDSASVFETFGGEANTAFVVTKGGFPFRDRGFYVANLTARQAISTSSSRRNLSDLEQQHDTRATIFVVSASFSPESASAFSASKYNTYQLPVGRVFVDGWILETLDPYAAENYAIPSTRCTRVVAVDYGGSVPAAVNSMINAMLPKSIVAVETYVKGTSPPPLMRLPAAGMVVSSKQRDLTTSVGEGEVGWALKRRDPFRSLVITGYQPLDRIYQSVMTLTPSGVGHGSGSVGSLTSTNRPNRGNSVSTSSAAGTGTGAGSNLNPGVTSGQTSTAEGPQTHQQQQQQQATPRARKIASSPLDQSSSPSGTGSTGESGVISSSGTSLHNATSSNSSDSVSSASSANTSTSTITGTGIGSSANANTNTSTTDGSSTKDTSHAARAGSIRLRSQSHSRSRDALRPATSSMFTIRGEVRQPIDLLVAEMIVDSKLYPEGYEVKVKSRIEKCGEGEVLGLPSSASTSSSSSNAMGSSVGVGKTESGTDEILPINYAIYTLPPTPHHSSGLNTDRPPRHLVRLTLPTAQYQVSTIQDPLTGETQQAPPKPQWLLDLEEGGRAVLNVEVRPWNGRSTTGSVRGIGMDAKSDGKVKAGGKSVVVVGEKESLTSVGRDELLDTRMAKMDLLVRAPGHGDQPPRELQEPIAIAKHLLDESSVPPPPSALPSNTEDATTPTVENSNVETNEVRTPEANSPVEETRAGDGATGGLLRFLNSYPNPLFRFSSPSPQTQPCSSAGTPASGSRRASSSTIAEKDLDGHAHAHGPRRAASSSSLALLGVGGTGQPGSIAMGMRRKTYPLSTLIVVALIAFLLGSLLRSLISPADFIYVVNDVRDAGEVSSGMSGTEGIGSGTAGGWREIKRLFEVKYVLGGWDFQIAAVRRH
ncbi:hypothetical protein K474DRAFT_1667048 [Panus rudis PR-1116 ss-1]|nr:hypothetical protein K474DRAFT_1667048 [Panus rudis PR-1116 ss-1]